MVRPAAQGGSASSSLKEKGAEKRLEARLEKTRDISPVAPLTGLAPPQLAIPELMMPGDWPNLSSCFQLVDWLIKNYLSSNLGPVVR